MISRTGGRNRLISGHGPAKVPDGQNARKRQFLDEKYNGTGMELFPNKEKAEIEALGKYFEQRGKEEGMWIAYTVVSDLASKANGHDRPAYDIAATAIMDRLNELASKL